jgi:hypothetical protein
LPIRIALATVSGLSTRSPSTSGAAPAAWNPYIRGDDPASLKPFQYAVMLPALPTGMHNASRSPPSSSTSSKAAVFCPSSRNGLTLLTSAIGWLAHNSRTSASAWSKLPRSAITRAPCISAWASLPVAILPSGTITAPRRPARAAYAAALAAVLPVDAQITAWAPSRTAALTAQVMPRSLNDPVGLAPSIFSHTSQPASSDTNGAATSGVEPSPSVTTGSPSSNGRRSRKRSIKPGMGRQNSSSMTRIARGAERMKSRPPIRPIAAKKRDSRIGCTTITSRAFSPSPLWTTDLTDAP